MISDKKLYAFLFLFCRIVCLFLLVWKGCLTAFENIKQQLENTPNASATIAWQALITSYIQMFICADLQIPRAHMPDPQQNEYREFDLHNWKATFESDLLINQYYKEVRSFNCPNPENVGSRIGNDTRMYFV